MFRRLSRLRAIVFAGCAILAAAPLWAAPAAAKIITFRETGVGFPIEVPDAWRIKVIERGVEISSPDKAVTIQVEATDAANVGSVVENYYSFLRKQGIKLRQQIDKRKNVIGGVDVILMDIQATFAGGPTVVKLVMTDPRPQERKGLFIGYWASPKGDQKHEDIVTGIMMDLLRP